MPSSTGSPPQPRTRAQSIGAFTSRTSPGPGTRSGGTSSSPVLSMPTRGRRRTAGSVMPMAASAPMSAARSLRPARSTARPGAASSPRNTTFWPGAALLVRPMSPPP